MATTAEARPPSPAACDIVMKGGVTSGVAYPAAVGALKDRYEFRSIGGASAGAIAAAVTAAAQYAKAGGGMERLAGIQEELVRDEGLLPRLFRPTREARPLMTLLLRLQRARSPWSRRGVVAVWALRRLALPAAVWTAFAFAFLALVIRLAGGSAEEMRGAGRVLFALVVAGSALMAFAGIGVARVAAVLRGLPAAYYGLCLGTSEGRAREPALTEWLHARIQHCAGLPPDRPLTFADLEPDPLADDAVRLRMMTTDLTLARPVRYPLARDGAYLFDPDEWRSLFPPEVMAFLEDDARWPAVEYGGDAPRTLRPVPGRDLPVVVATRMSLAFPVLLAAVPVWQLDAAGRPHRHWMSDGGITSNFPIHFFDSWLPRRPTFGLNLIPERRAASAVRGAGAQVEYSGVRAPAPDRAEITSVLGLGRQILDTMQNWRDTLQAELPGFRDRIAHIRLSGDEGGMNITMPREVIARVAEKGQEAGQDLVREFDFARHWLTRYLGLMREVQTRLLGPVGLPEPSGVHAAFAPFQEWLAAGPSDSPDGVARSAAWCREAAGATADLLAAARAWLPDGVGTFADGDPPVPAGVMRLTPDV